MLFKRLLLLSSAMLLAACQTAPKELPDIVIMPVTQVQGNTAQERFQSRQKILKKLGYWQLGGKLSIKGSERPTSAQLVWNQRDRVSALDISGPIGIGSVSLEISPGMSMLRRGNGKTVRANTPEELIGRVVGWPMPASLLRWWVVGLAGHSQLLSVDAKGRPEGFQHAEWSVSYSDYQNIEGLPLPGVVLITDGHLQFKLTHMRWRLQPEPTSSVSHRVRVPGVDD